VDNTITASPWGINRWRAGGADGGARPRALSASHARKLRGICEANRGPHVVGQSGTRTCRRTSCQQTFSTRPDDGVQNEKSAKVVRAWF